MILAKVRGTGDPRIISYFSDRERPERVSMHRKLDWSIIESICNIRGGFPGIAPFYCFILLFETFWVCRLVAHFTAHEKRHQSSSVGQWLLSSIYLSSVSTIFHPSCIITLIKGKIMIRFPGLVLTASNAGAPRTFRHWPIRTDPGNYFVLPSRSIEICTSPPFRDVHKHIYVYFYV